MIQLCEFNDSIMPNNICFPTQLLTTLNNIRALLKSDLIDLSTRNFVHAKTSLRARCVHARHRERNLLSPENARARTRARTHTHTHTHTHTSK